MTKTIFEEMGGVMRCREIIISLPLTARRRTETSRCVGTAAPEAY